MSSFEIAQALRKSHCDRKGHEHECVGEMTVCRGEIKLKCQLCGTGEEIPGWSSFHAERLGQIFKAAGIEWDALDLSAKADAVRKYRSLHEGY